MCSFEINNPTSVIGNAIVNKDQLIINNNIQAETKRTKRDGEARNTQKTSHIISINLINLGIINACDSTFNWKSFSCVLYAYFRIANHRLHLTKAINDVKSPEDIVCKVKCCTFMNCETQLQLGVSYISSMCVCFFFRLLLFSIPLNWNAFYVPIKIKCEIKVYIFINVHHRERIIHLQPIKIQFIYSQINGFPSLNQRSFSTIEPCKCIHRYEYKLQKEILHNNNKKKTNTDSNAKQYPVDCAENKNQFNRK